MFENELPERKWLTPEEEIKNLLEKKQRGRFSEHDEERMEALKKREAEEQKIREFTTNHPTDKNPSSRKPGEEGYL